MSIVLIVVHPDRLELRPRCPRVRAAVEPLRVGIDWSDNRDTWEAVRIGRFARADGSRVATRSAGIEFRRSEGNVVKQVHFRHLESEDVRCRGELLGTRCANGKTARGAFDLRLAATEDGPQRRRPAGTRPVRSQKAVDKAHRSR